MCAFKHIPKWSFVAFNESMIKPKIILYSDDAGYKGATKSRQPNYIRFTGKFEVLYVPIVLEFIGKLYDKYFCNKSW